ncbi:RRM domain-containing protein [Mycena chlorophos]|uniref:RRM domain-containing protein n=1 Tax=Mycena chlorophos TaxID=658473 RepID=A0A8H6RXR9_MYCCL|nr:RRM domain-containing protein [Mycena chlorophos]
MSNVARVAADSTLYHLSPRGFWARFRAIAAVNDQISTGLPLPSINRFPPPASRPEKYSTPATKASDVAQNPYWKRDVRRAYPRLSVVTQPELSSLLIEHSAAQAVAAPAEKKDVPAEPPVAVDLSVAIAAVAQNRKIYSTANLPPTLPVSRARWAPELTQRSSHKPLLMSTPPPSLSAGLSAQAIADAFAGHERIYFDRDSNTWRYEESDGTEMEYDGATGKWVALVGEEQLRLQQAAYSVSGVDEETPAAPVLARENKKRKEPEDYTFATPQAGPSKRGKKDEERKSKNTAVFVSGLPVDAELDEIVERFSKCGVLEEDDDGDPKVKMYALDDGTFSGEALVVYFKEDSVFLAERMLDDAELRIGDSTTVMRVAKADFAHKSGGGSHSGESKPRKTIDKKKASRRIVKMQKKLADWDEEDGFGPSLADDELGSAPTKNSRVVVLKHMFTLKALEKDASLLLDLKEDVREECSTLGEVTNVVLYDKEPDGIMTVKFRDALSAQACVLARPYFLNCYPF